MAIVRNKKAEPPKETALPTQHRVLCERAARWLRSNKNCVFSVYELVAATNEQPDAIGFKAWESLLVEVKTSRSDFLRNKKKYHQQKDRGMGNRRYFLCPPGIIKPEDLTDGWGLLYAEPKKIVEVVRADRRESNTFAERVLLTSILRRKLNGCEYLDQKMICKTTRATGA